MTKRRSASVAIEVLIPSLGLLIASFVPTAWAQTASDDFRPRMATFDNAQGETCYALSLGTVDVQGDEDQTPSDVVVYVDTSASQTGEFKQASVDAVQSLMNQLNADDRVQILAVDLEPVAMTNGWVSPGTDEVQSAIDKLGQRVPLGSTNLNAMLGHALESSDTDAQRNRNVIYIGDGISRAGVINDKKFNSLVRKLVRNQISVSGYAVGAQRDVATMACLANHTGGNIYVAADQEADPASKFASFFGKAVHHSVFWPKSASLPGTILEVYPNVCPPIRSDRDSMVYGTIKNRDDIDLIIEGEINGQTRKVALQLEPEASSEEFSFLSKIIDQARTKGGNQIPTVGSEGLREYARVLDEELAVVSAVATRSALMGDGKTAANFAKTALNDEFSKPYVQQVAALTRASAQDDPFGDDPFGADPEPKSDEPMAEVVPAAEAEDADPFGGEDPFGDSSASPMPAEEIVTPPADAEERVDEIIGGDPFGTPATTPAMADEELPFNQEPEPVVVDDIGAPLQMGSPRMAPETSAIDRIMQEARDGGTDLIGTQREQQRVIDQKLRKQVQFEVERANREIKTNPDEAINRLKNMIEITSQTPELSEATQVDLRFSLESALNSARRQKLDLEVAQAESARNVAVAAAQTRLAEQYERKEEKLARLINQFDSLMKEDNYISAAGVAETIHEVEEFSPESAVAHERARAQIGYERSLRDMELREQAFMISAHKTDRTMIAFLDDRLITFPDAEEWLEKKNLRKRFANARLTGSAIDEAIISALDQPTNLEYEETPFADVKAELEERFRINIVLDQTAEDDQLNNDELITVRIRGVRLKNALRLMLRKYNATYIVRDEVLRVISLDNINDPENLVTDVYNVGDLVAPRFNAGGIGGQGGLGGGGQVGGGGGIGGGGGGIGGGGGGIGGGGGGGVFCIQDAPVSTIPANGSRVRTASVKGAAQTARPIELNHNGDATTAWSEYFSRVFPDAADVRATVRKKLDEKQYDEIVSIIQGAIRNDNLQPWMFEALGLAMELAGKPQHEVERAFMSAVDFSTQPSEAMEAAKYMMKNGMEKRSLQVFADVATAEPTAIEPYRLGLEAAERIGDLEGQQWAVLGILSQELPESPALTKRAKYLGKAILKQLEADGDAEATESFRVAMNEAKQRDCVVELSYTGDADVDLYVKEPAGTVCSRLIRRTTSGGVHLGDEAATDPDQSGKIVERYVLPKGFSGEYQVIVKKVTGAVTSGKVNVDIRHHVNSDNEVGMSRLIDLGEKGFTTKFELAQGRRTDSLEEQTFNTLVDRQMAMSHTVLAQALSDSYNSGAASEYYGGLIGGGGLGENPFVPGALQGGNRLGGAVGYQPQITNILIATSLQVQHATTSDRLYVMVSLSPFITDLSAVENFNILGNANNAGAAGGIGGQAGGAGGQGGAQF